MQLLAINGFKRAGKDTVANMIKVFGGRIHTIAFADKMKQICSVIHNVPIRYFYDETLKDTPLEPSGLSPRNMMTLMNETIKGNYGDDYFVRGVDQEYEKLMALPEEARPKVFLATDLRFDVEAKWVIERGGKIIRVRRPSAHPGTHDSEKGIPGEYIWHDIHNNGDFHALFRQVNEMVLSLGLDAK